MKKYKIMFIILMCICIIMLIVYFISQNQNKQTDSNPQSETNDYTQSNQDVLVVYFSQTNTTENIAKHIGSITDGDIFKIEPMVPYTDDDLDYNDGQSRTSIEQNNRQTRPEIANKKDNIEKYDVIYIGYPIWHGQAPRIISTFLESYEFKNKTLVPFCTSHVSDIGTSASELYSLTDLSANWLSGKRFQGNETQDEIRQWISSLELSNQTETSLFDLNDTANENVHTI